MSKRRQQIQKRVQYTLPGNQMHFDQVFYYTVNRTDDNAVVVQQVPARPIGISTDEDSLFTMLIDPKTMRGFAINITWISGKPDPETPERTEGLLAVVDDLEAQLPDDVRTILQKMELGIGHMRGAKATFTEQSDPNPIQ